MTNGLTSRVVLVGCGKMGSAIVRGAVASGALAGGDLWLVDTNASLRDALAAELGARTGWPEPGSPTLAVIAVKPQYVEGVLRSRDWCAAAMPAAP